MIQKRKIKIIAWVLVLLWMGLIFYLSHQPATKSSELSSGIVDMVVLAMGKMIPFGAMNLETLHYIIRKGAHFTAYFILGLLVINALKLNGLRSFKLIILTLIICVLYAASDEFHQVFIPGRSGEIKDVLIDSSGSTFGIICYLFVHKLIRFKKVK